MVEITGVEKASKAWNAGIRPGDYLIKINNFDINDVLDYRFYLCSGSITLTIHRGAELFDVVINKGEYDDIGLVFNTYLMDEKRSCRNKCIFCFIDQLPKNMRETLYFKDDDSRLSFLTGSYITLTNLSRKDIDRIISMKISPINISVHTTNPELRVKMMNNKNAGTSLSAIKAFYDAKINMNAQIVICRGINDKEELTRTMTDLASYYPYIVSVSVVPSGLTKFRQNLYPLSPYSGEECRQIIRQVDEFALKCLEKHGSRIFYCADELYIKAGLPIPDSDYYEGYPQLENGVGLITSMKSEFYDELNFISDYDLDKERNISIATGVAAYDFILSLVDEIKKHSKGFNCTVYKIENNFFGENITVAGLVTGCDLKEQLSGKPLGDTLFIPSVMLRYENDMFLDSMTKEELEKELNVKIDYINNNGIEFISKLLS